MRIGRMALKRNRRAEGRQPPEEAAIYRRLMSHLMIPPEAYARRFAIVEGRVVFSRFFINRPIFASVLSIVIVLAGSVALFTLPVAQYPEIAPPTVEISASYPGANAEVVADTVAAPIEQQVNGVEGMMYMSSQCTNDGSYTLTVK